MLATSLPSSTPRTVYMRELTATLAQIDHLAEWQRMPWALLALNATFYLEQYLTAAAYRDALANAVQTAASERQGWATVPSMNPAGLPELHRLGAANASRVTLYRWLFERALDAGQPAQFLLAHHACEIAEVLAEHELPSAVRLGLVAAPRDELAAVAASISNPIPDTTVIEFLCHALLRQRITPRSFAESLLLLHAAHRAHELTGIVYAVPLSQPDPTSTPARNMSCVPKRLRIVQPHELALRAVESNDPFATTTIEAGLVEAEALHGAPQLLLLSALDRALASLI